MNNIYLFWYIGKNACKSNHKCNNIIEKLSNYYSYSMGNSYMFTRENIHLMRRFYLMFPVFNKKLEDISWEQYKLLLSIRNKRERYFYFYVSLFFNYDYADTRLLIDNNYFLRI